MKETDVLIWEETLLLFSLFLGCSTLIPAPAGDSRVAYGAKAARLQPFCFRTNAPVCFSKPANTKEPDLILSTNSTLTRLINAAHLVKRNLVPN